MTKKTRNLFYIIFFLLSSLLDNKKWLKFGIPGNDYDEKQQGREMKNYVGIPARAREVHIIRTYVPINFILGFVEVEVFYLISLVWDSVLFTQYNTITNMFSNLQFIFIL